MTHRIPVLRLLVVLALLATITTTATVTDIRPASAQAGVTNDCPGGDLAVALYGGSGPTVGLYGNTAAHLGGAAGYCVQLVSAADWAIMTVAEFEQFDVLWIGNDNCSGSTTADFNEAISSRATWEDAIDPASVMIAGGDYDWHYNGDDASARAITQQMITTLSGADKPGLVLQAGCYSTNGHPWFQLLGGTFAGLNHGTISGGDPASAADLYPHDFNTSNGYVYTDWVFGWSCHGAMSITPGSAIEDYNLQPIFKVGGQDCFYMSDPAFAPQFSSMTLIKSDPTGVLTLGETVTYSFTVTNTGSLSINSIAVSDDLLPSVTCLSTTLLAGETTTCSGPYTVTQDDVDTGTITNVASVTGIDENAGAVSADSNTVVSDVHPPCLEASNIIEHLKVTGDASYDNGTDVFTLTQAVNNQAGTLMSESRIDLTLPFSLDFDLNLGSSDGGADGIGFVFHNDPAGVDAIGAYGGGMGMAGIANSVGIEWDTHDNSYVTGHDDIANDHTGIYDPETLLADPLYYGTTAQLVAPIDLGNIEDSTWRPGSVSWDPTAQELTYEFDGSTIATLPIDLIGAHIGGNEAHFGFSASTGGLNNLQQVRFTNINAVIEPGTSDCDGDGVADNVDNNPDDPCIDPAQGDWTEQGTNDCDNDGVTVAAGDTDDFDSCALASADNPTCLGLDITKSAPTGTLEADETITYSFVVTNTGSKPLTSVGVTDDVITGGVTCLADTLAVAAQTTCSGDYLVTQDDVDAGQIVNTATATGTGPLGTTTSDASNTVTSAVPQNPLIDISKSITSGTVAEGETVTYTIVVSNIGDVTLDSIVVNDPLLGGNVPCLATTLAPTASTTCTGTYEVTQSDVDAGQIVNTADVDADDPADNPVTDTVTETSAVAQNPSIDIQKSVTSGTLAAGETVTYTIVVSNTGDVTLDEIAVNDPLLGGAVTCGTTTLGPAAQTNCVGTYDVTQADVDAGQIVNNASVDADDPADNPVTDSVSETTAVSQTPGIDLDKQPPTGTLEAGETITYPFLVTNTGNVTLTSISVSDPTADPVTCDDSSLAPAATTNCTATYLITQADVDNGGITNNASVDADDPNNDPVTDTDSVTTGITQTPAIDLDKQPPTGTLEVGETITYPFLVTNTGNVTLTNISVSDPTADPVTCDDSSLAPAATTNCTATYLITQADVDNGGITNNASVDADDPNNDPVTDTDSVTTPIAASPTMQVVKAITDGTLAAGETITYTITVTNTGNVTLSTVAVDDPLLGGNVPCNPTTLAPDASATCSGTYQVTQADVDNGAILNEATATAQPPSGDPIDGLGTLTSNVPQNPSIDIAKALTAGTLAVDETITYTLTVTNTGDVTLSSVTANDPLLGGDVPCATTTLAPNASTTCVGTYNVTQTDVDAGQIINNASTDADDPNGDPVTDTTSLTTPVPQNPAVDIAKALTAGTLAVGETITYTLTVTNTGDVTLSSVTANDPLLGGDVPCATTTLAPNASTTCVGTYNVTQTDVDAGQIINNASTDADDPNGDPVTDTTSLTTPVPQNPAVDIAKALTAGTLAVGETITYTLTVTNTGDVTLSSVTANDPLLGGDVPCATTTLAPNASTTCVGTYNVTQTDVDAGQIINNASTDADDPNGDPVTDTTSLTTPVPQNPAVDIAKSISAGNLAAGEAVTYTIVVSNIGDVTLSNIVVNDPLLGGVVPCGTDTLAPAEQTNCATNYVVTQANVDAGEVVNNADVDADDPQGGPVTDTVTQTNDIDQTPGIDIDKQPPTGTLELNETITYPFVVTNTGNVTLANLVVTDPTASPVTCDDSTLAPGLSTDCTASYVVTQSDVDAGQIINTATASATDPNFATISADDTVTSGIVQTPAIDLDKQPPTGTLEVGETLTYGFTVTNTGNVTLSDIVVTDPTADPVSCDDAVLAPGATTSCTATYVITQADVDAGGITNNATVTATDTNDGSVTNTDSVTTPIAASPIIDVVKNITDGTLEAGETITYTITVTNTGNVTLTAVAVDDPLLGGDVPCDPTTLAPGASADCVGTYAVTQADVDAGQILNEATGSAQPPSGDPIDGLGTLTSSIVRAPDISLSKAITAGELAFAGETITYTITPTNTGNVTLSNLRVTDPLLGGDVTCADASIAPGASTTCVGTYVVTQTDVDSGQILNTADVVADSPDGTSPTATTSLTSPIPQVPGISLTKSVSEGTFAAGETITYQFAVTNTGNVSLTDIEVSDPLLGGAIACGLAGLAPDRTGFCFADYIVTQDDVEAGEIVNTATVTATDTNNGPLDDSDTLTSEVPQNPAVDIAKAITAGTLAVDETVTYTITVTNIGDVTLTGVAVSDPLLGGSVPCLDTELGLAETTTCTGSYVVTQADVDAGELINTASATAAGPDGTEVTDTVTLTSPIDQNPMVDVAKSVTAGTLAVGETVTYTIIVTNTGDVTLDNVQVTDPLLGGFVTCPVSTIAPLGETSCAGDYVVTQHDMDEGRIVNTARVDATDPSGDLQSATVTEVTPLDQSPAIDLDKQPPLGELAAGEAITYPFIVTNTGNVTLTDIDIDDPAADPVTCTATTLAPGENTGCFGIHIVTQAEVDTGQIINTATVSAVDPDDDPVEHTDSVTSVIAQIPAIDIDKQTPSGALELGAPLSYDIVLTNVGNVTLTNVSVEDPLVGGTVPCPVDTLVPGDTTTCTAVYVVTQADIDAGEIVNEALVFSTSPSGGSVSSDDRVQTPIPASPTMEVTKALTNGELATGETITYTITVANTGNVTLTAVTVDDPLLGGAVACGATSLAPGASTNCVGTYVVTQDDVDVGQILNEASATATTPSGATIDGAASLVSEIERTAALVLDKGAPVGTLAAGQSVSYTITATNTGNVTLTAVTITDPMLESFECPSALLLPGDSTACLGSYTITQADVDAGQVTNTATVSASAPDGTSPDADASNTASIDRDPAITVSKWTVDTDAAPGNTITYRFLVTNAGNTTLTNVAVVDDKTTTPDCPTTTLAPGATVTCTATYVVTDADADAGQIVNTAVAMAAAPDGSSPTATDTHTLETRPVAGVEVNVTVECVNGAGRVLTEIINHNSVPVEWVVDFPGTQHAGIVGSTPANDTSTSVRTGRPDGEMVIVVEVDGVLIPSTVTVNCSDEPLVTNPPLDYEVDVSTECVNGDGRIVTQVINNEAEPIDFEMRFPGTLHPDLQARALANDTTIFKRSGRPDGESIVIIDINGELLPFAVTVDCEPDPVPLDVDVDVYPECVNGDGRIVTDVTNNENFDIEFNIEFPGTLHPDLLARALANLTSTFKRSGRPDGTSEVIVVIDGQRIPFTVTVNCDGPPDTPPSELPPIPSAERDAEVDVYPECFGLDGRIVTRIVNNDATPAAFDVAFDPRPQLAFNGTVGGNDAMLRKRSGRPDGPSTVTVTVAGVATPYVFDVVVACDSPQLTPPAPVDPPAASDIDVDVEVFPECFRTDGRIVTRITNHNDSPVDIDVAFDPRPQLAFDGTVAANATWTRKRSGRPDGTSTITVVVDGVATPYTFDVTVACD